MSCRPTLQPTHKARPLQVQVTAELWQLAVVHADLPAHLMALKNYFLLAKGDFYHSFLAEASKLCYIVHS